MGRFEDLYGELVSAVVLEIGNEDVLMACMVIETVATWLDKRGDAGAIEYPGLAASDLREELERHV
jgi:hypothetical protein